MLPCQMVLSAAAASSNSLMSNSAINNVNNTASSNGSAAAMSLCNGVMRNLTSYPNTSSRAYPFHNQYLSTPSVAQPLRQQSAATASASYDPMANHFASNSSFSIDSSAANNLRHVNVY